MADIQQSALFLVIIGVPGDEHAQFYVCCEQSVLLESKTVKDAITVIWLYFALKIFRTLLFRAVLISYAPDIVYKTRVKVSLLKNIRTFNFRMDGSVRN